MTGVLFWNPKVLREPYVWPLCFVICFSSPFLKGGREGLKAFYNPPTHALHGYPRPLCKRGSKTPSPHPPISKAEGEGWGEGTEIRAVPACGGNVNYFVSAGKSWRLFLFFVGQPFRVASFVQG